MKNISKILLPLLLIVFLLPIFSIQAQVQPGSGGTPPPGSGGSPPPVSQTGPIQIQNPFKCPGGAQNCDIVALIRVLINEILIPIGAVVAVVMVIYAGLLYVTAAGNETKIKKAHEAITWAVIGAAILLGAWVISEAIQGTIETLKK